MGEKRNTYVLLVGKPQGKRPLGRTKFRWVYNIKIVLERWDWDGMDWVGLKPLEGSFECCNVPLGSIK
jgi:hypothetical protein